MVSIIMGSKSDYPTMEKAENILTQLGIKYITEVVSAHRTPDKMVEFAKKAEKNGIKVIIAGAGGAAHLPGMVAALTHIPVMGVPIKSKALNGQDSLLSIVQMPKGVGVATFAIGDSGAFNAGLMAAQILALTDQEIKNKLLEFRDRQTQEVLNNPNPTQ